MEREELIQTVTRAQQGDGEALNLLFNTYYNDVYYFALKTLKDEDLACDITQETFVKIIGSLDTLKEPAAFVSWMKQIAYHFCTQHFRKKKEVLVEEDEEGGTIFDTVAEDRAEFIPDEAVDRADFRATIMEMIDNLSEEQRSAVLLYYFDELSVKQIAQIQGVPENTVKGRLNYARKSIKSSVEDYEKKNGVKLHCAGVLPLLLWLFADYGRAMSAKSATAVANGVSAAAGTTVTVASATAGTVAGSVAVKVAVGVLALTVAVGGVIGLTTQKKPEEAPQPTTVVTEPTQPSTPQQLSEAQLLELGDGLMHLLADTTGPFEAVEEIKSGDFKNAVLLGLHRQGKSEEVDDGYGFRLSDLEEFSLIRFGREYPWTEEPGYDAQLQCLVIPLPQVVVEEIPQAKTLTDNGDGTWTVGSKNDRWQLELVLEWTERGYTVRTFSMKKLAIFGPVDSNAWG